jgi:hypothetical protein
MLPPSSFILMLSDKSKTKGILGVGCSAGAIYFYFSKVLFKEFWKNGLRT